MHLRAERGCGAAAASPADLPHSGNHFLRCNAQFHDASSN